MCTVQHVIANLPRSMLYCCVCRIIAKISLDGSNFLHTMEHEIPIECIPEKIGGKLSYYNEPYEFNTDENGPLSYPGCPLRAVDNTHGNPVPLRIPWPPAQAVVVSGTAVAAASSPRGLDSAVPIATAKIAAVPALPPILNPDASSQPLSSKSGVSTESSGSIVPPLPTGSRIPDGYPGRWKAAEAEGIRQIRELMKTEMASIPPFPEVVGDRRVVRFLRARNGNVADAVILYRDFLNWYKANNVADVRNRILYGRCNQPSKFPHAKIVLKLQNQIVISATATDKKGSPIVVETFNFSPAEVFRNITVEQYLEFLLYTLEFRTLIFEQMSEIAERKYLESHPDPRLRTEGFGVTVSMCSIRDLSGLGFAHMSAQAKQMLSAGLKFGIRK
jgi:hypothetical protein